MTPPTREQFDDAAQTIKTMSPEQKDLLLAFFSFVSASFLGGGKTKEYEEAFTTILTEEEKEILKSL